MTTDEARRHLRYSTWASRRLLDAALKLDADQLHREMSVSHKSVHGTLSHILIGDRIWLARVTGRVLNNPREIDAIEIEWPRVQQQWETLADGWSDADLVRTIAYTDMQGNPYESPLWQIVMHVVNHATLHRGQVMAMFRQLGLAPPPTDLMFYYREQQSAHA
jgi:uncharacterized damage-inducible protein DinB